MTLSMKKLNEKAKIKVMSNYSQQGIKDIAGYETVNYSNYFSNYSVILNNIYGI